MLSMNVSERKDKYFSDKQLTHRPSDCLLLSDVLVTTWHVILTHCGLVTPCDDIDLHYLGSLHWRHYRRDDVSNQQPRHCLLNRLFRGRSKKASKLRVTGLCVGNSPVTSEFPAQMASNAENVSIWWRHHVMACCLATHYVNHCWHPISKFWWHSSQCNFTTPAINHWN